MLAAWLVGGGYPAITNSGRSLWGVGSRLSPYSVYGFFPDNGPLREIDPATGKTVSLGMADDPGGVGKRCDAREDLRLRLAAWFRLGSVP